MIPNNFFSISDKTIKLWKVSERDRRAEGYNLKEKQPFSFFDLEKIETQIPYVYMYYVMYRDEMRRNIFFAWALRG